MPTDEHVVPPDLKRGLRNYWYPILLSDELPEDRPVGIRRLAEDLVVWRDDSGTAHTFRDRCAHRHAKLSIGDIVDGRLQCRYHGLQYDSTGQCRMVPLEGCEDGPHAKRLCVTSYPTEERGGMVWSYLGDVGVFPPPPLEIDPELTAPDFVGVRRSMVWDANWLLIRDNTTDPFHVTFLHGHFAARAREEGLELEQLAGGNPVITAEAFQDTVSDEIVGIPTEKGVLVTRRSATEDHSQTFDEVQFDLPYAGKVWVPIPDGGPPIRSLQYEVPIDEHRTAVLIFDGRRCSEEKREETLAILEEFVWPNFKQVFEEDSWIANVQGDIDEAWRNEHPLPSDAGPLRVRKCILDAYRAQQERLRQHPAGNGEQAKAAEAVGS